jgi:HEAT repeat protein
MRRRRLALGAGLVLVVSLLAVLTVPAWRGALLGLLRGEAFYAGRPASSWREEIYAYHHLPFRPPLYEQVLDKLGLHRPPTVVPRQTFWDLDGDPDAVPVLRTLLRDSDGEIRLTAVAYLSHLDADAAPALPELTEALQDGYRNVRLHAALAVWRATGEAERVLPVLRSALQDSVPANRWGAGRCLEELGPAAAPAVDDLVAVLKGPDPYSRGIAARALGAVGPAAAPAVPALTEALKDPKAGKDAAGALGAIGPSAREALPALQELLANGPGELRPAVALACWQIDGRAEAVLPALRDALKDKMPETRERAAEALGRLGPAGRAAVPDLLAAMQGQVLRFPLTAALALWRIDRAAGKQSVPMLVQVLRTPEHDQLATSLERLDHTPGIFDGTLGELQKFLEYMDVRTAAADALGAIGPDAREAVPALLEARKDSRRTVRQAAVRALRRIDPQTLAAVEGKPGAEFWVLPGVLLLLLGAGLWGWLRSRPARCLLARGKQAAAVGRWVEGEEAFLAVLRRQRPLTHYHHEASRGLDVLVMGHVQQARFAAAEALYGRYLSALEGQLGWRDPRVGSLAITLAGLLNFQGKYDEAEAWYQRDRERFYGRPTPDEHHVAWFVVGLSEVLLFRRPSFKPEAYIDEDQTYRERILHPDRIDLRKPLTVLVMLAESRENDADAEQAAKCVLAVSERVFGADDARLALALEALADVYQVQGRAAEAEDLDRRAKSLGGKAPEPAGANPTAV